MSAAPLIHHLLLFLSLSFFSLLNLFSSIRSQIRRHPSLPYHPLPFRRHLLRHLPLYLLIIFLLIPSTTLLTIPSAIPPTILFLLSLLSSLSPLSLSSDLSFLLSSLSLYLLSSSLSTLSISIPNFDLQSSAAAIAARISLSAAAAALTLALSPKLFPAEIVFSSSILLGGLWAMHSGLVLYLDSVIPNGCHRLLESEYSTRCEIETSRSRASELMELGFVIYASATAAIAVAVYAVCAKAYGGSGGGIIRRLNNGSYEALPTSSSAGSIAESMEQHVQMKSISKNALQE